MSSSAAMASTSAEDALARARAIAARLSGTAAGNANGTTGSFPTSRLSSNMTMSSAPNTTNSSSHNPMADSNITAFVVATEAAATAPSTSTTTMTREQSNIAGEGMGPPSSTPLMESPTALGETTTTKTSTTKRKRWGVTPDTPATLLMGGESATKQSRRLETDTVLGTTAAAKTTSTVAATSTPPPLSETKRLWIRTTKERPPRHFVLYLRDRLPSITNDAGEYQVTLGGRGASDEPPLPGMPEQPLHVVIQASHKAALDRAETAVEILLDQAEQAAPLATLDEEDEDRNRALIALQRADGENNNAHIPGTVATGTYRPASVAQLIGQAKLPPNHSGEWMEETVHVPNGVVGFIIGRGGENISSMQARTGAKVQIQKEHELQPGQAMRTITLQATSREAIEECRKIILDMVKEKAATFEKTPANKDERILQEAIHAGHHLIPYEVPDADVGLIIGRAGATIKSIQDQTGAQVQIPPAAEVKETPQGPVRIISITHPNLQGAEAAKIMIDNLLKTKVQTNIPATGPVITIQVSIPDKDVGLCIGRQGCVIREMQNRSQAKIQIPSHPVPGDTHRIATVTGTKVGCEKVRQMIEQIILAQSSAPVMVKGYDAALVQAQPQQYSTEWAAYHAAQAAVQQQQQQHLYVTDPLYSATTMTNTHHASVVISENVYGQQQQQQQQQQNYYSSTTVDPYSQQASVVQPVATQASATDTYHEQFFRYAYYYGEEAARAYYGAWAPPIGTQNPYGVNPLGIQPAPSQTPVTTDSAGSTDTVNSSDGTSAQDPARDTSRRKVSNLPAWMTKG